MRISALVFDLSNNCLVRSYPILKVMQRKHQVEIIGPQFGDNVFLPYGAEFTYKAFRCDRHRNFWSLIRPIAESVTGDVIYVFKPRPSALYPGLYCKWKSRIPMILDVEDWEPGWSFPDGDWKHKIKYAIRHPDSLLHPGSIYQLRFCEFLARFADEVTVVSSWLEKRFGGVRLLHGADRTVFDPSKVEGDWLRTSLGLEGRKVIIFTGTPVEHKGLEDLLAAIKTAGDPRLLLLIIGGALDNELVQRCLRIGGTQTKWLPYQPHHAMPQFLAMSDFVALPQRRTQTANAQIPGKVFEAMAMARPIIATTVSDLPEILRGAAALVEPSAPDQIAAVLRRWLAAPDEARTLGERARTRFLEHYSYDAMESVLDGVLDRIQSKN
jgi:glycosyltransferase involved in cell wall biosynthesis